MQLPDASRDRNPRRATALWIAAFLVASLAMLLGSGSEPVRQARQSVAAVLEPARAAIGSVAERVMGVGAAVAALDALRQENEALRAELAAAEQRVADLREAATENAELRDLLRIAAPPNMELLPASVMARDGSNFVAELSVDAGSDDGVRLGMAVMAGASRDSGALVGTVVDTTATTALVRLVVDDRSVVIGQDLETRALGEVRGQAAGGLVMLNVPVQDAVEVGDTIVTAHITVDDDSTRHPPGLVLGRVTAVETDVNAVTRTVYVDPIVDATKLERLMIVLDFER